MPKVRQYEPSKFLRTSSSGVTCNKCLAFSFEKDPNMFRDYFLKKEIRCPGCNESVDWWDAVRHYGFEPRFPGLVLSWVGGMNTVEVIYMNAFEAYELDLQHLGIPRTARIIQISYTPNGKGLFPIEMHGNTPLRTYIPHVIRLIGWPVNHEGETDVPVAVSINWTPENQDDHLANLAEAYSSFEHDDFSGTIIPANRSLEGRLKRIMTDSLSRFASNERVKSFLDNNAPYSIQLNILAPLLAEVAKLPPMSNSLRGSLNRLRDLRNDMAHEGRPRPNFQNSEVGDLLCSALFGLAYFDMLDDQLKIVKNISV